MSIALRCFFVLCSFLGFLSNSHSQDTQPISLEQALRLGLENAYTLQAAQKTTAIAQNNNNYGEAGRYPTITFNINNQNTYNNINNPTSFLNGAEVLSVTGTGTLDASWILFEGFKVRITKNRLELLEMQTEGNARLLTENLILQITRAYYQAQVQRKRWQLLSDLLRLSREKIQYIEARREYGQAVEFDRLQILDAYLNDSIQWEIQRTTYQLALQNLAMSIGLQPTAEIEPADSLLYELPDYEWEEIQQNLIQENQQLENLRLQERLAAVDIELRRTALYPRITFNGGLSDQIIGSQINGKQPQIPNTWRSGNTLNAYLNFGLNYTIYNGGKLRRAVENARLQQEITQLNTKDSERNLSHQLRILWERYAQQRQIYALTIQLNENAVKNLRIAEEKFKLGTLNFFDLRTIQTNYIRSINSLQDAFLNAKVTEIELLQLAGLLVGEQ